MTGLHLTLIIVLIIGALSIAVAVAELTGAGEAARLAWMLWRERRERERQDAVDAGVVHPAAFIYFSADKVGP